jgi:hypothetical protein
MQFIRSRQLVRFQTPLVMYNKTDFTTDCQLWLAMQRGESSQLDKIIALDKEGKDWPRPVPVPLPVLPLDNIDEPTGTVVDEPHKSAGTIYRCRVRDIYGVWKVQGFAITREHAEQELAKLLAKEWQRYRDEVEYREKRDDAYQSSI